MFFRKLILSLLFSLFWMTSAHAHFQLIYTPDINLNKAGDVPLKLTFWHPMENGHAMNMGTPVEFYSLFKGKKTDLSNTLKPVTFKGADAYDGSIKLKRNGDYSVIVTPEPYFEESEDIYIQHITKILINKGGVPTDWHDPKGLKTEIIPLTKPYAVLAGSTFSGIVISEGKPAAGIEIEVEHMTAEPNMATNMPSSDASVSVPGGVLTVISDENGQFTFGIPKAGYWGFAALGSGPDTEYNGKELSQDAVLWIKAHELRK